MGRDGLVADTSQACGQLSIASIIDGEGGGGDVGMNVDPSSLTLVEDRSSSLSLSFVLSLSFFCPLSFSLWSSLSRFLSFVRSLSFAVACLKASSLRALFLLSHFLSLASFLAFPISLCPTHALTLRFPVDETEALRHICRPCVLSVLSVLHALRHICRVVSLVSCGTYVDLVS